MTYETGGVPLEAAILARSDIWAVVPVKDLQGAKQRLAEVLSAKERQELFAAMLEDVLCALAASAGLTGILVVTRDPLGQRLAARYGARVLVEEETVVTPPPARWARARCRRKGSGHGAGTRGHPVAYA